MALIDRYLDALVKYQGESLVFATNANIELFVGGQPRAITTKPTSEDQILQLLNNALGAGFMPGVGRKRSYPYQCATGAFSIEVDDSMGDVQVRVRLVGATQGGGAQTPGAPAASVPSGPATTPPCARQLAPPSSPSIASAPASALSAGVSAGAAGVPSHMDELFGQMLDLKASDLHLKSNTPPVLRVDGNIVPIAGRPPLSSDVLERLIRDIMPERNRAEFAETNDTDFAYELSRARMRCNAFRDLNGVGAVFRQIPSKIVSALELGLPKVVLDLCTYDKGLVVVTGPTGSGKSTTLAAMIDWINVNRDDHIITIEDPIEFVHQDKKCLINQREVSTHTKSFKAALRAALREDPDIVLVGEMRDLETVAIAIETAETGHLVFGTLHTNTAPSTIDRLIDQFPADRQDQIRVMLAESLKGVVAQTLLKKKGGGRVAALEILLVTPAVANLIREGKTFQIPSLMQTGRNLGMQMLNDALIDLVKKDIVEAEEAYARAPHKKEFGLMLTRAGFSGGWNTEPQS